MRPNGNSEPAIVIAADGTVAVTGLQWQFDPVDPTAYGTNLWMGTFGSTPTFRGLLDASLQKSGKTVFGGGDGDVDLGATGTLHATSLIGLLHSTFDHFQLGVSAITCPNATSPNLSVSGCKQQIIDTAGADRCGLAIAFLG